MKYISFISIVLLSFTLAACKPNTDNTSQTTDDQMAVTQESETTETTETEGMFAGDLETLFTTRANVTCSIVNEDDNQTSSGEVYVSDRGEQMRGMFEVTMDGQSYTSNVLVTGGYSYVWGDALDQGFKTNIEEAENMFGNYEAPEVDSETEVETFDPTQNVVLDCRPWNVDQTMFDVPTNIEFIDTAAMMEQMQEQMDEACGACDQLSGDAQTQCQQALGC